ncbi:hypothetical protein Syun_002571 [Stephania yunnanensis]|uniref:Purple acid phosphatase n=1 Tax=Stephania yunnanensis TaxID=152371 RepID=A0AAP0LG16_9MAGN
MAIRVRGFCSAVAFALVFAGVLRCAASYDRPPSRGLVSVPPSDGRGSSSHPEQVHISMVGKDKMRICWITEEFSTPAIVNYGTTKGAKYQYSSTGTSNSYKYVLYKSGEIHDVVIGPLLPNTTYHYTCGADTTQEFQFKTPPAHFPIKFAVVGSYTDFENGSPQYNWLVSDLAKVDRNVTPWLVVLIHAPWYSTNTAHQGEDESVGMKEAMEELLYGAGVDIVFAGHVHAYERFTQVYKDQANPCGPVYINIGDGGNREGLASKYTSPQPNISSFREASFGHGELDMVNASYALWTWHRNDDDQSVVADSVWLTTLKSVSSCKQ